MRGEQAAGGSYASSSRAPTSYSSKHARTSSFVGLVWLVLSLSLDKKSTTSISRGIVISLAC